MKEFTKLPFAVEECLQEFLDKKFQEHNLTQIFSERPIRKYAFDLLEKFCTVLYYPLEKECDNNGFKLTDMPIGGTGKETFVFINTAQTIEKQIITAAHELGHIWEVDEHVLSEIGEKLKLERTTEMRENIINRFAAMLLMPQKEFLKAYNYSFEKYAEENREIRVIDMLRVIVELMNHFYAPIKSVVYRLVELDKIHSETGKLLLGGGKIEEEDIKSVVEEIINQYGFTHLLTANRQKWINGLPELLSKAEQNEVVSQEKIACMRELFGLEPNNNTDKIAVSIKPQEDM